MTPLVSAIISTYNSEFFIQGKIEDLLNQSIKDKLEIIIVNSGSLQNEENIIKHYLDNYDNIRYLKTENRETIYKAWNRGIKIASGKYITNSNTDDRLKYDALEILSSALEADIKIGMVYADQYVTSVPNISFDIKYKESLMKQMNYSRIMLLSEYFLGSQSMWRSDVHFNAGIWFDEKYEIAGDYDFALKVSEIYNIQRVPGVLGSYYKSGNNSNKEFQNIDRTQNEVIEIQLKYARRYIDRLSSADIKSLLHLISIINYIPPLLFSASRRLLDKISHRNQIPSRIFWIWLGSLIEEKKGRIDNAKKYCMKYLNNSNNLLAKQYEHLSKL
jgi:glycosyltransferase involved in cell wall biosynthesis